MKNFLLRSVLTISAIASLSILNAQLVTSSADDGSDGTLRQEIMDTPDGGEVTFDPSVSTVLLSSQIIIDKDITITGNAGDANTSIDAQGNSRIFYIESGNSLNLAALMLSNGLADDGGAVYVEASNLTANNCTFSDNVANGDSGSGGAIFVNTGGSLTISNSSMTNNQANRAGGAIEDNSGDGPSISVSNTIFSDNNAGQSPATAAPGNGGAFHATGPGSSEFTDCTIQNNLAAREGGGLWNGSGTMMVINSTVTGNTASGDAADDGGGGLFNSGGTLNVNGSEITGNIADGASGSGGGVFNLDGILWLVETQLNNNTANRAGGAIEATTESVSTLSNLDMLSNTAGPEGSAAPGNGGALHISGAGSAEISACMIQGNTAAREGGGLWNGSGTMMVVNSTIASNNANGESADDGGGGIFNNTGQLNLFGCIVSLNTATGASGSGGGIFNLDGSVAVSGGSLDQNSANRAGGAVEATEASSTSFSNVTISENIAGPVGTAAPGNGGGLHITGAGSATIQDCVIEGNIAAREGGGLWNGSGTMTVSNSTVTNNAASGAAADDGGGGIFNNGGTLSITATNCTSNSATGASGSGGAILNLGGDLTINGGSYILNESNRAGGAIEVTGGSSTEVTDALFDGNTAGPVGFAAPGNGGGIHIGGDGVVTATGSTFIGNKAANEGGGLWNSGVGTLSVDDCTVNGNWAPVGAGLFGDESADNIGSITITNSTISVNKASGDEATQGGGGIFNASTLIITDTDLDGNAAEGASGSGGAIFNASLATITNSTITGNLANRAGGGIEATAGSMTTLNEVNLDGNTAGPDGLAAPGNGGGMHITGAGDATITGGTVNNNVAASEGGGLWNGSGTMTVDQSMVMANTAAGAMADNGGAGLFNNGGTMTLTGLMIADNLATGASGSGGGLLSTDGSVTLTDCQVLGNGANRAGGGIELIEGSLTINACDVVGNDVNGLAGSPAPGNGGALHVTGNSAQILIDMSIVFANEAANEGGALWNQSGATMEVLNTTIDLNGALDGGGVFNNGGVTIINRSTLSENYATGNGAGIANETGTLTLMRSTVSGNFADLSGGGVHNSDVLSINASTIAYNFAGLDGGGIASVSNATVKNSIVAYNDASEASDVSGTILSDGYNIIATDDGEFTPESTDLVNVDPLLDILQDNGGFTFTHNLLEGSPAVDAGSPDDTFNDQRDYALIGIRDIGSVEFGGVEVVVIEAGTIATDDETVICAGDGIADPIDVTLTGGQGPDMTYIVTSGTGEILALAAGPTFDLEGAGEGNCLIYHLFYDADDITGLAEGNDIADLAGDIALSNFIEVIRNAGGCTDPSAENFDADACFDDGSCVVDECVTETLSSLVQGWQMTGLVWNPGDLVAVQPLHTNYSVVPVSGEEQGETIEGVYIQNRFFIGLDEDFHADFAGPGYTANTNWSDWGTYVSSLPSSNTTAIFNLSGTGDEDVLAFRWIGFLDANDDGVYTSGVDRYLGQLNQNGFALPSDASGRLYVGFSDRLNQFSDNLGDLFLTYCYGEEFEGEIRSDLAVRSGDENEDTIDDAGVQQLIDQYEAGLSQLEVSVYPNPNNGQFRVNSNLSIDRYEIMDMTGRVVAAQQLNSEVYFEVNFNSESTGIYLLKVYAGDVLSSVVRLTIE